jgi:amidohydrolase
VDLLDDAHALTDDLTELRHRLHRRPEIGLRLPRTQDAVLTALAGLGLEISKGIDLGSVTAVLRGAGGSAGSDGSGSGRPVVLLRADMDALPVHEEADVPYRSTVDGAMHACGHDLHTSMLVGAARLLSEHRDQLAGDVVLMFQPGEEGYDGARKMIDEGVLEAAGRRPDAAFALHVISNMFPYGQVLSRPGPLMAASDGMFVTVRGTGGHGSSPHLSRDPVPATCEMVVAMQTAINRQVDAFSPVVLTVGSLHAGIRRNIIPEIAEFEATIRTFDGAIRAQVRELATRVCQGVASAHGLEVDIKYLEEYPVTVNDADCVRFALGVAADLLGPERAALMEKPVTGTEDFSRVIKEVPGAMLFLGACLEGRDHDTAPSNHSPHAGFADAVIPEGAALYAEFAVRRLAALADGAGTVTAEGSRPREVLLPDTEAAAVSSA